MSPHGSIRRYKAGCRCEACRAKYSVDAKKYREGIRKRVQEGDPTVSHGSWVSFKAGCRCDACDAVARERRREDGRVKKRNDQASTLPTASRRFEPWTGPELELAARTDLTARQVAEMTGRTYCAVVNTRHRLREDPLVVRFGTAYVDAENRHTA